MISPELNIPQAKFLQLEQKFRGYVGGFGSGKTWAGCFGMCQHFYQYPRVNQGYFGPTYPHIRDIFYPTIEEVAYLMGLSVDIKYGNKEVHFYRGERYLGTTIGRSMENPSSIVGFKIGHALIDELDILRVDQAKEAWRKIIARLRWADVKNGADVTTTPEGFRETYRLFVEEVQNKPELKSSYGLIQASTRDNELSLPPDYIKSLADTYPAELIDAYIDGKFCNLTSGTVYRSFNRTTHDSKEVVNPEDTLYVGMDFNVTKMAATIYVKRGIKQDEWHAVAELKEVFDTPTMIKTIKGRWPGQRVIVYPDASGKSRKSVDANISDISLLIQAGFAVKAKESNPSIKDRVMSVNKRFEDGKLFVNVKTCPTVAKNLEQQSYDKNGDPDKDGGFDHQNDATGYPIVFEFPIVKPMHKVSLGGH